MSRQTTSRCNSTSPVDMFTRPQGAVKRKEIVRLGQDITIVRFAELRETIVTETVDPKSVFFHHSSLLLHVSCPTMQEWQAIAEMPGAISGDRTQPTVEGGWVVVSSPPTNGTMDAFAVLRADYNAASTVWYRPLKGCRILQLSHVNGSSHAAQDSAPPADAATICNYEGTSVSVDHVLDQVKDRWRAPGRPMTVADVVEPRFWYDMRFNNCQHFVRRAKKDMKSDTKSATSCCPLM